MLPSGVWSKCQSACTCLHTRTQMCSFANKQAHRNIPDGRADCYVLISPMKCLNRTTPIHAEALRLNNCRHLTSSLLLTQRPTQTCSHNSVTVKVALTQSCLYSEELQLVTDKLYLNWLFPVSCYFHQRMKPSDLDDPFKLFSNTTMRFTFFSGIYWSLLDGLLWILVQIFVVSIGCILMTWWFPDFPSCSTKAQS